MEKVSTLIIKELRKAWSHKYKQVFVVICHIYLALSSLHLLVQSQQ